jgi:hypothetical protein
MNRTPATRRTQAFLVLVSLLAVIWEEWTIHNRDMGDTISAAVWDWGHRLPWLVVAINVVWGMLWVHFWAYFDLHGSPGWLLSVLGVVLAALVVACVRHPGVPVYLAGAGLIAGALLSLVLKWQFYAGRAVK